MLSYGLLVRLLPQLNVAGSDEVAVERERLMHAPAAHLVEPGGGYQLRPPLLWHVDTEPPGQLTHLPLEVGLEIVVMKEDEVGAPVVADQKLRMWWKRVARLLGDSLAGLASLAHCQNRSISVGGTAGASGSSSLRSSTLTALLRAA
jgi:hypothetical protein